ncbi:hypothetical protein L596_015077 [Steinernema carpocapsae]|uniref:aECM cysteine-cradle domain-containing protein n=1 Tax=Steinernema carpocapsae TaxID=34508 RepID=A0A4U5NES1_STECR|nr:hypothetical protein L596_015077 [Steinernema carpocapsae]
MAATEGPTIVNTILAETTPESTTPVEKTTASSTAEPVSSTTESKTTEEHPVSSTENTTMATVTEIKFETSDSTAPTATEIPQATAQVATSDSVESLGGNPLESVGTTLNTTTNDEWKVSEKGETTPKPRMDNVSEILEASDAHVETNVTIEAAVNAGNSTVEEVASTSGKPAEPKESSTATSLSSEATTVKSGESFVTESENEAESKASEITTTTTEATTVASTTTTTLANVTEIKFDPTTSTEATKATKPTVAPTLVTVKVISEENVTVVTFEPTKPSSAAPEMAFSIDESPDDEALKPGMSFSIDMNPNVVKSDRSAFLTEKNLSALELFKERQLTEMAIIERQRQLEIERREREEHERRLREERQRLEQARRLREEQERLERMDQLRRANEMKVEQERRKERINQQLAELAKAERRQRELIERREQMLREREQRLRALSTSTPAHPDYPNFDDIDDRRPPQVRFHHSFVEPKLPETGKVEATTVAESTTTKAPQSAETFQVPDEQCRSIRRFLRIYKITDPGKWILENCIFAKQYFPQASCFQIQQFFESCF